MNNKTLNAMQIENYQIAKSDILSEDTGSELVAATGAGASVGATLGSVLPGVGTALGTIGGAAISFAASAISKIVNAIKKKLADKKSKEEIMKDPEIVQNVKQLEKAVGDDKAEKVTELIDKKYDVDLTPVVESLRRRKSTAVNEEMEDFAAFVRNFSNLDDDIDVNVGGLEPTDDENCVNQCSANVMTAYQNANKWLDIIQEFLYHDMNCPFFSNYVHNLAHKMPVEFDAFGDVLHTANFKIPYPATEYIPQEPQNVEEAFQSIFMILDEIKGKLNAFIECTDKTYHGMACASEDLLNKIEGEYPDLFKLHQAWGMCNDDIVKFDKYVNQYIRAKAGATAV